MKTPFTTNRLLGLIAVSVISLTGFTGYCYALADGLQALGDGVYTGHAWTKSLQIGALLLYAGGALHFMNKHLTK